jgi:heat shock protein HtpX
MKFLQVAKRITLLLLVNFLVMLTIGIIVSLIFRGPVARMGGYQNLFLFCFIWGMGGAFISLQLSRWIAKFSMGVKVIDPNTSDSDEQRLVQTVHNLARSAGLSVMPEVGSLQFAGDQRLCHRPKPFARPGLRLLRSAVQNAPI